MAISQKIAADLAKGSWIRKMFEEGGKLKAQYGIDKVFDFSLGNPYEEPPEAFFKALRSYVDHPVPGIHRYMPNAGFREVREAVAKTVSQESGLPVTGQEIVMTVGAGGALNVALKALLDPGDEVVVFTPYFVEYRFYIENHGGNPVFVPTGEDFLLDLELLNQAFTSRTKVIILNSPNNPTGQVYPAEQLQALGELLRRCHDQEGRPIYVLSDEPYRKLLYDNIPFPSIFQYLDNAIIATSHSKDLALAGDRIGYLAVNPRCAEWERLVEALIFCNRVLGFVNAPALLQFLVGKLQHCSVDIQSYQERRDLLYDALSAMGFQMLKPKGAFYLFPKSPIEDDVAFTHAALQKRIILTPGSGFGCPGYFRIAYCVPKEVIEMSFGSWRELAQEFSLIK